MSNLHFQLMATAPGSAARAGRFQTATRAESWVETPVFMPVGTQAAVKGLGPEALKEVGSRVLLANTYHLMLRPGKEVFNKLGGIHRFMNWSGHILTDSGGFQIFSLPNAREISEAGAVFKSYVDQRRMLLSPEVSIAMQAAIGSDIMMVLDQCIEGTASLAEARAAMELTHRWAKRSFEARGRESRQSLFGIVQGACHESLRRESADFLTQIPFEGFAIGGLAVGEGKAEREDFTELAASLLPADRPRYLMGVGNPIDLLEAVHRGVDLFDCIIPVSLAQQGVCFTSTGILRLARSVYKYSDEKPDRDCRCSTCARYSRAYLHHLIKAKEPNGWHYLSHHNLTFFHQLMTEIRAHILNGTFLKYYQERCTVLSQADPENPMGAKPKRPKPPKRATLGDYEIVKNAGGFDCFRQISSGESMHSVNDPDSEALRLYVEQPGLPAAFQRPEPLVIWDVGLGAATNAMAVLRCFEALGPSALASVRLVSFEVNLDPLKLVLKHPEKLTHIRHAAPHALLKAGQWSFGENRFVWELREGDFLSRMTDAPLPDVILYDPFSQKVDAQLWTEDCFRSLHAQVERQASLLCTYSSSTLVRARLLASGFLVASGLSTGPKSETTVAVAGGAPNAKADIWKRCPWLDENWLGRWQRSSTFNLLDSS
ncbi:MAG: tRNA guanosine(34) transglycosylase Tgt, partial [Bdellovibrionota bacterium]